MATKPVKKSTSAKAPVKPAARAAQKPAAKSVPAKKATVKSAPKVVEVTPKVESSKKATSLNKSQIVLAVVIVLLGVGLYFFRSLFVAAVVNGQPISRWSVIKETEKQAGKQTLSNLVRNSLIEQEAKKQNVTVSDKEINDEITKLEGNLSKQGQKLDQVLSVQGMTKDDLRHLIRLDKLVAKMVGKDVTVSDKEVADYMDKNKDMLPADQDQEALKKQVKDRLQQQKTSDKVKAWLEDLQTKAKVIYFVQY